METVKTQKSTTTVDSSMILYITEYISIKSHHSSTLAMFLSIELYCRLLDFKMYGIVKHRLPPGILLIKN